MDFDLNEDQRVILDAVGGLLDKHAGPARAIELAKTAAYDFELHRALTDSGFAEVALAEGNGPLEGALVVEAVSKAAGMVAIGASALVVPGVAGRPLPGPVALVDAADGGPVRFAPQARTLIVLDRDVARIVEADSDAVTAVASSFGYPMGRIAERALREGESRGSGSGERLKAWWRLALAAEAIGAMRAALKVTVEYQKHRRQFGRTIGSFQAVQHRMAECAVLIEGARWLTYEAAAHGAPPEAAAVAAAQSLAAAGQVFIEMHQLSGAIGFTHEHDLHVWSMRLQTLRLELAGVAAHRRAVAEARWGR